MEISKVQSNVLASSKTSNAQNIIHSNKKLNKSAIISTAVGVPVLTLGIIKGRKLIKKPIKSPKPVTLPPNSIVEKPSSTLLPLPENQALIESIKATRQKTVFTPEKLESFAINGATKSEAWSKEDMKDYYEQLTIDSRLINRAKKHFMEFLQKFPFVKNNK
jgi:hypothetical protein